MGSGSSKPVETTTTQPDEDEGIPISGRCPTTTFALPAHAIASPTPISPKASIRGGDPEWDPHTPAAELPARKRSRLPWRNNPISKPSKEPTSGYFADSCPTSIIETGSECITPGSSVFSEPSPASSVALSFGSIRRKPLALRPTASSPNLSASSNPQIFILPSRRAQNASTLSSLWESPAQSRPRRGSNLESTSVASPFGADTRLEGSRGQSPIPYKQHKSNVAALSNNGRLRSDAREIIDMERDLDLVVALADSLASPNQPKEIRRSPSMDAPQVWRRPSPAPSDSSDDLDLYRGRNNPKHQVAKRPASNSRCMSRQEQLDRMLAQDMQKDEEDWALSHESRPHLPGTLNTFDAPTFASSSSTSRRELHPNNPWSRKTLSRSDELLDNLWSKATSTHTLDADELLARQLQEEENSGVSRHVSRPQEDIDMALAMQLATEENQRLHELNAAPKTRDCPVCGEAIPIPELPSLMDCEHEPQVCSDCYQGWIASELNSKGWKEIKCPETGCKKVLHHAEVQQYATPEVYAKFDALSAREALNDDPNFRWCRGPNCKSGQIHESDISGNIFQCIVCHFKVCTVHEGAWHEGETCEEFDYRTSGRKEKDQKAQEAASIAAISQLTKKCPGKKGKCGWNIEKNDGCDHMTCTKCKHQFCWICMADYQPIREKGNSEHATSCKFHSSRLPTLSADEIV